MDMDVDMDMDIDMVGHGHGSWSWIMVMVMVMVMDNLLRVEGRPWTMPWTKHSPVRWVGATLLRC